MSRSDAAPPVWGEPAANAAVGLSDGAAASGLADQSAPAAPADPGAACSALWLQLQRAVSERCAALNTPLLLPNDAMLLAAGAALAASLPPHRPLFPSVFLCIEAVAPAERSIVLCSLHFTAAASCHRVVPNLAELLLPHTTKYLPPFESASQHP